MNMSSGGVATMVFRPVFRRGFGQVYLDGQTLNVLMMLDGKKTIEQVGQQAGIILSDLRQVILKLIKMRLVESVERAVTLVNNEFVNFLVYRMSLAIGPLGEIVVEETMEDLGYNRNNFPASKISELIKHLTKEIKREDKRSEFKHIMMGLISDNRLFD
jgi:molybdopterin converting factor small subunit